MIRTEVLLGLQSGQNADTPLLFFLTDAWLSVITREINQAAHPQQARLGKVGGASAGGGGSIEDEIYLIIERAVKCPSRRRRAVRMRHRHDCYKKIPRFEFLQHTLSFLKLCLLLPNS